MVERCMELRSKRGYISIGQDGTPAHLSRDWLNVNTYISGCTDRMRRVSMTIDPDKAKDLIELLQEYIEYRTAHPQEVGE